LRHQEPHSSKLPSDRHLQRMPRQLPGARSGDRIDPLCGRAGAAPALREPPAALVSGARRRLSLTSRVCGPFMSTGLRVECAAAPADWGRGQ
jgi:hypothetical protein